MQKCNAPIGYTAPSRQVKKGSGANLTHSGLRARSAGRVGSVCNTDLAEGEITCVCLRVFCLFDLLLVREGCVMKKTSPSVLWLVLGMAALFVSTGFADSGRKQPAKPRNASAEKNSAAPAGPTRRVVVILKSRGERVTIYSTAGKGPAFSIVSADGKTLAKEISLKELQAGYPSYYELYRTSYVNVWAGLPSASHRAGGAIAR